MSKRKLLKGCRRVVIKVGTSTLTHSNGQLHLRRIESLVREIADLHNQDMEVLLVSSGAIRVGANRMGTKRSQNHARKTALAAICQGALLHLYEKLVAEYGKTVAQVLITRGDFDERLRYLNATNAFLSILSMGVIPIINENDTVVVEEIKFGDNDTLSALVAGIVDADLLILLSDVDGFYSSDPGSITAPLCSVRSRKSPMRWKVTLTTGAAAFPVGNVYQAESGTHLHGRRDTHGNRQQQRRECYSSVVDGEPLGTLFIPRTERMHARMKWIAFGSVTQGAVTVDPGAEQALLKRGKSLLPSGVQQVEGEFERGAIIAVCNQAGLEIARGVVNYSDSEIRQIAGKKTTEIEKILGGKDYDEIIHRNNLWVE